MKRFKKQVALEVSTQGCEEHPQQIQVACPLKPMGKTGHCENIGRMGGISTKTRHDGETGRFLAHDLYTGFVGLHKEAGAGVL